MKYLALLILSSLSCLATYTGLQEVDFTLGPSQFRDRDVIEIEVVKATSETYQLDDTVTIRGRYKLSSRDCANISVTVTQTQGDGKSRVLPGQRQQVTKGTGEFELVIHLRHEGYLHVDFFPCENGSGFGGLYFGHKADMKAIDKRHRGTIFCRATTRGTFSRSQKNKHFRSPQNPVKAIIFLTEHIIYYKNEGDYTIGFNRHRLKWLH